MPFTLPPLPYPTNALEPSIDAQTMEIHHDKHHAAYVNNLNAALEKAPELQGKSLDDLLKNLNAVPEAVRTAVLNWNPTVPLPADYPSESAFFTVTFFYNQSPARAK